MKKTLAFFVVSTFGLTMALAQAPAPSVDPAKIVEIELLTHTEVFDKIHNQGMMSVLVVTLVSMNASHLPSGDHEPGV